MSVLKRLSRSILVWTVVCLGAWLAFAKYFVPQVIRRAYKGESYGPINELIKGQDNHPVETYLANWDQATWRFGIAIVVLGVGIWYLRRIKIAAIWNRYWFRPVPYLDLGVVRAAAVAFETMWLISWYTGLRMAFDGPAYTYDPLPILNVIFPPALAGVQPSLGFLEAVYWITILAGPLAALGFRTRITVKVFAYGSLLMHTVKYSFGDFHHPDAIVMMALVLLAFTPCGKAFSLDRWLAVRRARGAGEPEPPDPGSSIHAAWPRRLIQWMFALAYLSAAAIKLEYGGHDWVNGYTLRYYIIEDAWWNAGNDLGVWTAGFHYPLIVISWITLIFEWFFFVPVFWKKSRWVFLPLGIFFHVGIYFTLKAPFFGYIFLYTVFVPWSAFFAWRARRRAR